jgi:hypothetical protein
MSYTPRMRRSVLAVACAALLNVPTSAVTLAPLSFEQLVITSSAVVFGRVRAVRADWTPERHGVESAVTIDVIEAIKGTLPPTVTFTVPGGQVGRYLNLIPGAPAFARGDVAVVFLSSRGARLPVTTGFTQGIYRAHRAGPNGGWLVMPPPEATGRVARGDRARKPVPLAAFEASVRTVMDTVR